MNGAPTASGQTLRERVLSALEHFWCPLHVDDELRPYLEGTWGQPVSAAALAGLLAAERQAFDRAAPRPVWICLGLWPDGHGEPGWWARSDWPLWVRVVDPDGEQARRCWLLRQLYRGPIMPDDPAAGPLTELWVRLAAHLPTQAVAELRDAVYPDPAAVSDWEQDRFSLWAEVADSQFDLLAAEDRRRRERIAQRLAVGLSPSAQLFGRDHHQVVFQGGEDVPGP
jgi:hypothetical protein